MARYNTSLESNVVSGATTISSPNFGNFTQLTGTAPYTVVIPDPTLFPGDEQKYYNSTTGTVTLSSPAGIFTGTGGPGTSTYSIPPGGVLNIVSNGTNYVVISEDGSPLVATTGQFSGDVTANGSGATVSLTAGTVTIAPTGSGTINNTSIGATNRSSGYFTSLTANQATTLTANIASSSTTTGTLVITGGLGVSGTVTATNLTGTLQTAAQPNITSVGTLSGLTVNNTITAGSTVSTNGGTLIQNRYGSGNITIIGEEYSTGAVSINYAVRNSTTDTGFTSSADNVSWARAYLKVGGSQALRLGGATASLTTVGNTISVPELVRVTLDGRVGIGTSGDPSAKLDVAETVVSNSWTRIVARETASNAAFIGTYRAGSSSYSTGVFSHNNALNAWADLYINAHNDGSGGMGGGLSNKILMAGKVGINTIDPQTRLNINHGAGSAAGDAVIRIGGTNNYASLEFGIKGSYDGMIRTYGNDLHIYAGHWQGVATASENHNMYFYTSQNGSSNWSTPKMTLSYAGNLTVTGTITESSSITLKENIRPIENALDSVLKLVGKIYDRKDNQSKDESGLIAEEVFSVLPNLVETDASGNPTGVKYTKIIAYLIESIRDLNTQISALRGN